MKYFFFAMTLAVPFMAQALDFEIQMDNEEVRVSKIVVMPGEEIGLHRDENPRIVISANGGTITRIEKDGSEVNVNFPAGKGIFLQPDPIGETHRAKNATKQSIELFVVELKETKKDK